MTGFDLPNALSGLVGHEHDLDDVSRALKYFAEDLKAPTTGAYLITCSDESERECVESFHSIFVRNLLPDLKFWSQSSFRTANLGARYERGAVGFAEDHYATPESAKGFKLLVVKVNSHVSVAEHPEGPIFGQMNRYDRDSVYCGAIHQLFEGGDWPFLSELHNTFSSGGLDRLSMLLDPSQVNPKHRGLFAAIANATLQAECIAEEIGQRTPTTPTVYLLMSCVTLNRARRDTELVCGIHSADSRTGNRVGYVGLDSDPTRIHLGEHRGKLCVSSDLQPQS